MLALSPDFPTFLIYIVGGAGRPGLSTTRTGITRFKACRLYEGWGPQMLGL